MRLSPVSSLILAVAAALAEWAADVDLALLELGPGRSERDAPGGERQAGQQSRSHGEHRAIHERIELWPLPVTTR